MWKGTIRFMLLVVGIIVIGTVAWQFGQEVDNVQHGRPGTRKTRYLRILSQNAPDDSQDKGYPNLGEKNEGTNPNSKNTVPSFLPTLQWEPVGPGGGGSQYSPTMAPNNPSLMYGMCDMGGFYRSTDGGHHWRMVNGRDVNFVPWIYSVYGDAVSGPEFNPQDDNVALVAGPYGLARTADGGLTWQKVSSAQPTAIAFHGLDGSHAFFAGNDQRLYVSVDGGVTWAENLGWRSVGLTIRGLFIDASSTVAHATVYASTPSGIYKSTDGGLTWLDRNDGLGMSTNMNALRLLRLDDNTLYASVTLAVDPSLNSHKWGLFRSKDGVTTGH
ncbi:MAG TPA: hypothetical protein VMW38_28235 [Terriglobia bacterium]|nr:hypothetical protein [Terriglobia bacterium]